MQFHPSPQLISWFRDRYVEGNLTIKPPYQRRPVWAKKQKCYLIESILMGFPVPELYVQVNTTAEGLSNYAIVDGQQRIRAILQFIGVETDANEQEFNEFVLDQLPLGSRWKDLSFGELTDLDKRRFFGYQLAVRNLVTDSESELREMFTRLNKYLTAAKPQELRNARFSGPFLKLVESLADDDYWFENRIVSAALVRRMGDFEFVSELLIGVLHGPQGGSSTVIDEYYRIYEDYEYEFPEQRRARKLFEQTLDVIKGIFPAIKEVPRWGNKTDFYTLFVAVASLMKTSDLPKKHYKEVGAALIKFAEQINVRLGDEEARASENVVSYVRAVEKGANDKARRADRNEAVLKIIAKYFTAKAK